MKTPKRFVAVTVIATLLAPLTICAFTSFITLQNGYFFDPETERPWVPHGMAYQTWNRPVGVWQTYDQIDYDLDEMVKMGVNSVRIDMVWKHIEEKGTTSLIGSGMTIFCRRARSGGFGCLP